MANNPVQIVLNQEAFITTPERGRLGPIADPFRGRDDEFIPHKRRIKKQIDAIAQALDQSEFGKVGYARVILQEHALAKSNRPVRTMFPANRSTPVGAGNLGELFYRVSRDDVDRLAERVDAAEDAAKWSKDSSGREIAMASAARADVAAIAELGIPEPEEKRAFDVRDAVEWLEDPNTDGRYQIELFEQIPDRIARDDPRRVLFRSFDELMRNIGRSHVSIEWTKREPTLLTLRLGEGARLASAGAGLSEVRGSIDREVKFHRDMLGRLARHPLVRRISLPVRLHLAERTSVPTPGADLQYRPTKRNPDSRYPKVGVIDSGVDDSLSSWIEARSEFLDAMELKREHGTQVAGLLVEAQNLNGNGVGRESDGCLIYDVPLYIEGKFRDSFSSFDDFLNQIDLEVGEMATTHGVRVFNMSITADSAVEGEHYGRLARRLDEILDTT
jgi:hypothetical protein